MTGKADLLGDLLRAATKAHLDLFIELDDGAKATMTIEVVRPAS